MQEIIICVPKKSSQSHTLLVIPLIIEILGPIRNYRPSKASDESYNFCLLPFQFSAENHNWQFYFSEHFSDYIFTEASGLVCAVEIEENLN